MSILNFVTVTGVEDDDKEDGDIEDDDIEDDDGRCKVIGVLLSKKN